MARQSQIVRPKSAYFFIHGSPCRDCCCACCCDIAIML
jgi:hypothetical protein